MTMTWLMISAYLNTTQTTDINYDEMKEIASKLAIAKLFSGSAMKFKKEFTGEEVICNQRLCSLCTQISMQKTRHSHSLTNKRERETMTLYQEWPVLFNDLYYETGYQIKIMFFIYFFILNWFNFKREHYWFLTSFRFYLLLSCMHYSCVDSDEFKLILFIISFIRLVHIVLHKSKK